MQDLLLSRTLRLTVVGTISILSLAALILGYQALFDTITGSWHDAIRELTWSAIAAVAGLLMIRYRDDLIDC